MAERGDAADAGEWLTTCQHPCELDLTGGGPQQTSHPCAYLSIVFPLTQLQYWNVVQLIIPAESAHSTITALGEVGLLEFRDLNEEKSAFQRSYASQVRTSAAWLCRIRIGAWLLHRSNTGHHCWVSLSHGESPHGTPHTYTTSPYHTHTHSLHMHNHRSSAARRWLGD